MSTKPHLDVHHFATLLPEFGVVLGLDLGERTIGLAISDVSRTIASPLTVISRGKFSQDWAAVQKIIAQRQVTAFVVGMPFDLDGKENVRCQKTRAFGRNLQKESNLPLLYWDERLSTQAVNRMLIDELDATRQHRDQVVDKLAAAYFLQACLDRLKNLA